tara:strand:+ start:236 stop:658 length:423 start_codon:yes stop_codon:yes gene_type:complete
MGYGTREIANLPVVNRYFTIEQLPQSHETAKTGLSLVGAINTRLAANTTLNPRPVNFSAIVISNDHATVSFYLRTAGADIADKGIVVGPGESLFLAFDGQPVSSPTPAGESPAAGAAPANELVYQSVGTGTTAVSVAVYY